MVTKLSISPCDVDESGNISVQGSKFEVMLNPSGYKHGYAICYNEKKALGQSAAQPKFKSTGGEKVDFDIVLDGTGVVGDADVDSQVNSLNAIVYKYDGNNHQPNLVRLLWGSFIFFGRLNSMSIDYTLFRPSGVPLRAKVKLAFTGYVGSNEEALAANRSSPDLTHLIEVKAGDTLPLLCHRIYKDSSYYLEVAKINGLTNFRNIRPGTKLHFPPLR